MKRILPAAAATLALAAPAAAQHSRVFECLQRAPAAMSADAMLDGCRQEVQEWLNTCEQIRDADVCVGAVTEEAALAFQQRQRP